MVDNANKHIIEVEGTASSTLDQITESLNTFSQSMIKVNQELETYNKNTKKVLNSTNLAREAARKRKLLPTLDGGLGLLTAIDQQQYRHTMFSPLLQASKNVARQNVRNTFGRSFEADIQQNLENILLEALGKRKGKKALKNPKLERELTQLLNEGFGLPINKAIKNVKGMLTTGLAQGSLKGLTDLEKRIKSNHARLAMEQRELEKQNKLKDAQFKESKIRTRVAEKQFNDDVHREAINRTGSQVERLRLKRKDLIESSLTDPRTVSLRERELALNLEYSKAKAQQKKTNYDWQNNQVLMGRDLLDIGTLNGLGSLNTGALRRILELNKYHTQGVQGQRIKALASGDMAEVRKAEAILVKLKDELKLANKLLNTIESVSINQTPIVKKLDELNKLESVKRRRRLRQSSSVSQEEEMDYIEGQSRNRRLREGYIRRYGSNTEKLAQRERELKNKALGDTQIYDLFGADQDAQLAKKIARNYLTKQLIEMSKDDKKVFAPTQSSSKVFSRANWTVDSAEQRAYDLGVQRELIKQRRMSAASQLDQAGIDRADKALQGVNQELRALTTVANRLRSEEFKNTRFNQEQTRQSQYNTSMQNFQNRQTGEGRAMSFMNRASYLTDYMMMGMGIGGIVGSFNFLRDFEAALKQTQAIASATDGQMVSLKKSITAVSDASRFSAIELAEASTILAQAGFSVKDIEDTLSSVATLATATGSTLSDSVDIATSVLSAFKMSSESMPDVVNQITQAMNLSKLDVPKFMLATQYAANAASDLGIGFREMLSATAAVSNTGIRSGSTMGTGMRQLLADLATPTEKFKTKLRDLGLTLSDIDVRANGLTGAIKNLQRAGFSTTDAFDSFELRATAYYIALSNNLDAYDDLYDSMSNSSAAAKAQEIQMNSLAAQSDRFTNQVKLLVEVLGSDLRQSLTIVTRNLADFLVGLNSFLDNGVIAKVLKFTVAMAGFLAITKALSMVTTTIGGLFKLFGSLASGGTAVSGAFTGLLAILRNMNPYVLAATTAVTALTYAMSLQTTEIEKAKVALDKAETGYNKAKESVANTTSALTEINERMKSVNARIGILSTDSGELANAFTEVREKARQLGIHLDTDLTGSVENLKAAWLELRLEMQKTLETQLVTEGASLRTLNEAKLRKIQAGQENYADDFRVRNYGGLDFLKFGKEGAPFNFLNPDSKGQAFRYGKNASGRISSFSTNQGDGFKPWEAFNLKALDSGDETVAFVLGLQSLLGTNYVGGKDKVPLFRDIQKDLISALEDPKKISTLEGKDLEKYLDQMVKSSSLISHIESKYLMYLRERQNEFEINSKEYRHFGTLIDNTRREFEVVNTRITDILDYGQGRARERLAKAEVEGARQSQELSKNLASGAYASGKLPEKAQMAQNIYSALRTSGFSHNQAAGFVGDINREGDLKSENIFGTHNDAARGENLGLISWQGSRRKALEAELEKKGLLNRGKDGKVTIKETQEAIQVMTDFLFKEIQNNPKWSSYLDNKDISIEDHIKATGGSGSIIGWALGQKYLRDEKGNKTKAFNDKPHIQKVYDGAALVKTLKGGGDYSLLPNSSSLVKDYSLSDIDKQILEESTYIIAGLEFEIEALKAELEGADEQGKLNINSRIKAIQDELSRFSSERSNKINLLSTQAEDDKKRDIQRREIANILGQTEIQEWQGQFDKVMREEVPNFKLAETLLTKMQEKRKELLNDKLMSAQLEAGVAKANIIGIENLTSDKINAQQNQELKKLMIDIEKEVYEFDKKHREFKLAQIDKEIEKVKRLHELNLKNIEAELKANQELKSLENERFKLHGLRRTSGMSTRLSNMDRPELSKNYTSMQRNIERRALDKEVDFYDRQSKSLDLQLQVENLVESQEQITKQVEAEKKLQSDLGEQLIQILAIKGDHSKKQREIESSISDSIHKQKSLTLESAKYGLELEKARISLDNMTAAMPEQISLMKQLQETYIQANEEFDSDGAFGDRVKNLIDNIKDGFVDVAGKIMDASDNIDDFFKAITTGSNGAKDAMKAMLYEIVRDMAKTMLNRYVQSFISLITGSIGDYMGSPRGADGGNSLLQTVLGGVGKVVTAVLGGGVSAGAAGAGMYFDPLSAASYGKFSDGGRIGGDVKNRDSVPILAQPDEFMLKESTSKALGYNFLDSLNNRPTETMRKITASQPRSIVSNHQETAVYVVTPDQVPASVSDSQIIAVVADHLDRNTGLKQKIKTVVNRG